MECVFSFIIDIQTLIERSCLITTYLLLGTMKKEDCIISTGEFIREPELILAYSIDLEMTGLLYVLSELAELYMIEISSIKYHPARVIIHISITKQTLKLYAVRRCVLLC